MKVVVQYLPPFLARLALAVAALLAIIPTLNMFARGGGSIAFYVAVLLALALCAIPAVRQRAAGIFRREYFAFCLAMMLPLAGVLLSQAATDGWAASDVERALRLGPSVCLLLYALLRVEERDLQKVVPIVMLAGLMGAGYVITLALQDPGRPQTRAYNAVGYANLLMLFGAFALYSLKIRFTAWHRMEAVAKMGVTCLALFAVVLTQTRSTWIAFPVFCAIGVVLFLPRLRAWRVLAAVVAVSVTAAVVVFSDAELRDRADLAQQEIHECAVKQYPVNSSTCIRFQLWRAGWIMFQNDPWFGNGNGKRFAENLQSMRERGLVSDYVAQEFREPHNDVVMALASYGVLGLVGVLSIYIVPAVMFARRLRRFGEHSARAAAAMGLALCVGFVIFGQMELMFRSMRTVSMYAAMIALFLALSHPLAAKRSAVQAVPAKR